MSAQVLEAAAAEILLSIKLPEDWRQRLIALLDKEATQPYLLTRPRVTFHDKSNVSVMGDGFWILEPRLTSKLQHLC